MRFSVQWRSPKQVCAESRAAQLPAQLHLRPGPSRAARERRADHRQPILLQSPACASGTAGALASSAANADLVTSAKLVVPKSRAPAAAEAAAQLRRRLRQQSLLERQAHCLQVSWAIHKLSHLPQAVHGARRQRRECAGNQPQVLLLSGVQVEVQRARQLAAAAGKAAALKAAPLRGTPPGLVQKRRAR